MVSLGQKVRFDPFDDITGFGSHDNKGKYVTGTVAYINEAHKWFSADYEFYGTKQRTSFKFCDIGKAVTVCDR